MSKLPRGSVDTHFHVMDTEKYALSPSRHFTPPSITTQDAIDFHTSQGFDRTVVTQALSFGNDLSHLLQYLETRGSDKHRAIVTFEPSISDEELRALHAAGARSVRIDLHYHKAMKDAKKQLHLLKAYGKRLSDCKGLESWSIQLFHLNTHLWDDPELQQAVQNLEVPLVVDHFAGFSAPSRKSALRTDVSRTEALEGSKWSLEQSPGFDSFRRLLKGGKVWVKLSAPYRVSSLGPSYADLEPLIIALVSANPDRIIFGTDWPHTPAFQDRKAKNIEEVEPYSPIDDASWHDELAQIVADDAMLQRIFVTNPIRLYGFPA